MRTFLDDVASQLCAHFTAPKLEEITIILPTRRAGLFFQQALARQLNQPVWSPRTTTLEEFGQRQSSIQPADSLLLVFRLYEIYKELTPTEESFDKFFFWGEMLLEDFNQTDHYLLDARMLFTNLEELNELDQASDYLSEEQIEIIKGFWHSFSPNGSPQQRDFVALWKVLYQVYKNFKEGLLADNIGYSGMLFRQLAEQCKAGIFEWQGGPLVFAGLNELSPAELSLVEYLVKHHNALAIWNRDAYYEENPIQEAGFFLRKYHSNRTLAASFAHDAPNHLRQSPPNITITGVPLEVGQAKAMSQQLQYCLAQQTGLKLEQNAIVLPDEHLLFPVLHSLPNYFTDSTGRQRSVDTLNVTMGYPLKSTSLYSLIEALVYLQESTGEGKSKDLKFHYRAVLACLRHPYVYYNNEPELAIATISEIETKNKIYLKADKLQALSPLYSKIFIKALGIQNLFDYLLHILEIINEGFTSQAIDQPLIEQEFIYQFFTHLKRLRELVERQKLELRMSVFLKLLRQIIQSQRLPFSGEPLGGLQIMGVLETRALDFENLFILSMNEGSFPPAASQASFIPYNLRRGYGLPTFDITDSAYAYYFYSMIERAKNVHIFYNTSSANGLKGEPSRLLYQLMFESGFKINQKVLTHSINLSQRHSITIKKDADVMGMLFPYLVTEEPNTHRFTPSAFNIYLDCKLKFYFKYVARIKEADEVQEEIDAAVFGNMVHLSLEKVYTNLLLAKGNSLVTIEDFIYLEKQLPAAVDYAYSQHFNLGQDFAAPTGRNQIIYNIIKKLSRAVLTYDRAYAPFAILALESKNVLNGPKELNKYTLGIPVLINGQYRQVAISGVIDRIDCKDDVVRVLDYKTGSDQNYFDSIAGLFNRDNGQRNKAAMQTILYGILYKTAMPDTHQRIVPGLFNSRQLFTSGFSPQLYIGTASKNTPLYNLADIEDEYMGELSQMLQEIMDPEEPFTQTDDEQKCSYCPYKRICHK